MNFVLIIYLLFFSVSCAVEELEEGSYSCQLHDTSDFADGTVSCIDIESPALTLSPYQETCDDWNGVLVTGVKCRTAFDQLGCSFPVVQEGFRGDAVAWYKPSLENSEICDQMEGIKVRVSR